MNRLIGLWWLAKILYPDKFPEDMRALTRDFYSMFYHRHAERRADRPCAGRERLQLTRSALPGLAIATAVLIAGLLLAFTVGRYPVSLGEFSTVLFAKVPVNAPTSGRPSKA